MTIRSDIPAPAPRAAYPFASMVVGDCYEVALSTSDTSRNRYAVGLIRAAANAYAKRHGVKWQSKTEGGVWRLWRTA